MQRTNDFIKGLAGRTITTALLLGLPVALLATIGWPLPTAWPGIDTISRHITDGDIPDAFLIKLIACVVWIVWAQIAAATVLEYVAIVQGKVSTRTPLMPGVRLLAAKLATWTTLLLSAFAPIRPAMAVPLQPVPALTAVAAAAPIAQPDLVPEAAGSRHGSMVAEARYQTVRGDTWWDISEGLLGDGMRWNDIRTLNIGSTQPDGTTITEATETVRPGWALAVPVEAQLPSVASNGTHVDTVTVEVGDHFWSIAEDTLAEQWGREATDSEVTPYWAELVEANKGKLLPPGDPDMIYPAQEFGLPAVPPNPDIAPDLNGNHVITAPAVVLTPAEPEEAPVVDTETPVDGLADTGANQVAPSDDELRDEPAPAAPNPDRAESADSRIGDVIDDLKPIAATAGALALLGGSLLFTLRRLRAIQAARRRPGTVIDPPPDEAASFEQRIRAISTDGEDVRYIAAANDYLSHKLENASTPIPSVIAVRAGQFGLELLLDEPCEPVEGFHVATADKTAWRLSADLDVRMMEAEVKGDAHPFAPAFCVVGATEAGSLLVDLEQLSVLSIEGSPSDVADFQRGLLASTCVAPWASQCEIVALGIDGLAGDELSRATTPTAPKEWAEQLASRMRHEAANLDRSPYEERIDHGIVLHPTIVFIGPDEDFAGIAQHLAPVANLAYSPLAVVSAHPLANEYRIVLEEGSATLEPFGLTFEPVSITPIDLEAIDQLIASASDTSTSPPVEWADEMADHETAAQAANGAGEAVGDIDLVAIEGTQTEALRPAVEPVSTEPTAQTLESIAEILKPRPIEVHILGRHPRIEGVDGEPTPKIEAIVTYLAFHREVAGQRLRDEFWPGATSRQGCDNAISRVRALFGESGDGTARLETKRATHSYRISDDIGLDWHRAERLVAASKGQPPADESAYLDAACELIDGHVAADASPANYGWLLREPTIYTLIETTLVDAAHRRGELALAAGDSGRADWAARKGLAIVEGQEAMYRMRMEAASEAGDLDGVNSAYREARRAAESYGYDEEVQPETQALFEKLTRAGRDTRSDSAVR